MWKQLARSVQGSGHKRRETVCQDACLVDVVTTDSDEILIVVASDGAGSATHSDLGSQTACRMIHHVVREHLLHQAGFGAIDRDTTLQWYGNVRSELEREAERMEISLRELSCTLLLAIVGRTNAVFCQIGDGAIIIRDGDAFRTVFWPQSGEYANTTNFVTSQRIESDLMLEQLDQRIDEIAVITDGLQSIALNFAARQAHQPFFHPLFDTLRKHPHPTELLGSMQSFLESKNVTDRTDDDLTLILAIRANGPPADNNAELE